MAVKNELPLHEDDICQFNDWSSSSRPAEDDSSFDMFQQQHDIKGEERKKRAAWKYLGYPELSRRIAEHSLFRKFGVLNVRVLLKLQDEVVQLERELERMDEFTIETPGAGCGSLRIDACTPRGELLDRLKLKLREYNTHLKSFFELQSQPSASTEQVHDLQNWLADRPNIVEEPEQEFAKCKNDLIVTKPNLSSRRSWWAWHSADRVCSRTEDGSRKLSPSCLKSTETLERPFPIFSTAEALMLISPTWAMAFTCGETERMIILGLFTVWFFALLLINRRMSVRHRFVAVAGYLSMVVIMQCLTPTCPSTVSSQQTAFASPAVSYCAKQTVVAKFNFSKELLAQEAKLRRRVDTFS